MTSKVVYTGDLRTLATHVRSGSTIETDAPGDNQGKGERFSPTDLVAVALATCILTTYGISNATNKINIVGAVCYVEKIMVSNPRKIGEIKITLEFPESAPFSDREKQALEITARSCPVMESLHPDCKKTLTFNWPV